MISSGVRSTLAPISRSDWASSDSGIPNMRTVVVSYGSRAFEHRARAGALQRLAPHRVQLARRPRKHDHDRPSLGAHHQAGRGPDRVERLRTRRHHRLLAVRDPQRLGVEAHSAGIAGDDLGDPRLHRLVEDQFDAGEAGDHLGGEVVGGRPEPAAGDDQLATLVGEEGEPGLEVGGAVADHEDVDHLDPELAQALGDPGAVAVADSRRDHLGPGDEDARSHAHDAIVAHRAAAPTPAERTIPSAMASKVTARRGLGEDQPSIGSSSVSVSGFGSAEDSISSVPTPSSRRGSSDCETSTWRGFEPS